MEFDNELVREAWINFKAGDMWAARRIAERALAMADDGDTKAKASYILSQATDEPKEKREYLETVLAYDRTHAEARRALAILDGKLKPEEIVNADRLPAPSSSPEAAKADRFACPQCGARRVFAPDGKSLVCEHCGYNDSLANGKQAEERDFFIALATSKGHGKPVATQVFHCEGCGAEFVLALGLISVTCAYCDSPHVVRLDQSRDILPPDAVIPHALTQRQAIQALVQWVEANGIQPARKVDVPRGVYLPIWTFDLAGGMDYSGETIEPDPYHVHDKLQVRHVRDQYPILVNDLPVPASKKSAAHLTRLLSTFDLSAAQPYDPRLLAAWPTEIYDISVSDASLEARAQVARRYNERLKYELTHLENLHFSSSGLTVESFKLVLLPVWLTEIPTAGETIHVVINGQSGAIG